MKLSFFNFSLSGPRRMTTNSMNAGNEEHTDNVMNKFYEGRNEAAEKRKMDAAAREAGLPLGHRLEHR